MTNTEKPSSSIGAVIVDDSITYRNIMKRVLESLPDMEIIDYAVSGRDGIEKIAKHKPDIAFLDVELGDMSGIDVLKTITKLGLPTKCIMVSSVSRTNAEIVMEALNLGALDFVTKPDGISQQENKTLLLQSIKPLIALVKKKGQSRLPRKERIEKPVRPQPTHSGTSATKIELVAIGVSTGGPTALREVIPALPADLPVPVVIVQHMPPLFTTTLAQQLSLKSSLAVVEVTQAVAPGPGHVYIAPGGLHLVVSAAKGQPMLVTRDTEPVNNCKPSVDVFLQSAANVYGSSVLTVMLTGMGNDGTEGVRALHGKGGICLVQDEESSVVWGMPGSVVAAGLAHEIRPLTDIAGRITMLVKTSRI